MEKNLTIKTEWEFFLNQENLDFLLTCHVKVNSVNLRGLVRKFYEYLAGFPKFMVVKRKTIQSSRVFPEINPFFK